jgi:hypothetical protein
MLPSFTSHESPGKSPAFRAAVEFCENETAWGEYFVHLGAWREFPGMRQLDTMHDSHTQEQNETAPTPIVTLRPEVASTAITHSARYAAYDDAAEARRLAAIRRTVDEEARPASGEKA